MFSVIIPCDTRWPLLHRTMQAYLGVHPNIRKEFPGIEFIVLTRDHGRVNHPSKIPGIDLIQYYQFPQNMNLDMWCNPAQALNLGVRMSLNENVVITCPEVMPVTPVLKQFRECRNRADAIFAHVTEGPWNLISSGDRNEPGRYFLACFQKSHLLRINGWDEDFMQAYGYEDTDFGRRFGAMFTHVVVDEIHAIHQEHPRPPQDSIREANAVGKVLYETKMGGGEMFPVNGIRKVW